MFLEFFNVLRLHGLKISLDEWLVLIDALNRGMAENSLMEFYYLCRNVLIKSETEYDKFDQAFAEYFRGIESVDEIPQELRDWLSHDELERMLEDMPDWAKEYDLDTLRKMFRERLQEQTEKHDGGNYWVGTGGTSPFGHGGYNPAGIRVGGEGRHQSAIQIAGERNFRDFRQDNELDTRQFQMAFRKLRIDATCDNAGLLKLVYEKPRKNTVKLLLLMDSDGSMRSYSRLCSQLFQAVNQSTHLKDLKIYYFHNCIYDYLYTDPYIIDGRWIETDWVFRNLGSDYKVIIVGDAAMSSYELTARGGNINWYAWNNEPGLDWLKKFNRFYRKVIWLNPIKESRWTHAWGARTIQMVREIFPMFELTLNGLDKGIHKLLTN